MTNIFFDSHLENVRNILTELNELIKDFNPQEYPDFFREIVNRNYRWAASEGLKFYTCRPSLTLMSELTIEATR